MNTFIRYIALWFIVISVQGQVGVNLIVLFLQVQSVVILWRQIALETITVHEIFANKWKLLNFYNVKSGSNESNSA